jgi:putative endonuclease
MTRGNRAATDPSATAPWYVYILECRDGAYYVGITTDLQRRLAMHNGGLASRFTRVRRPVRYRYAEPHVSRSAASKRELELKRWKREKKGALFHACANLIPP